MTCHTYAHLCRLLTFLRAHTAALPCGSAFAAQRFMPAARLCWFACLPRRAPATPAAFAVAADYACRAAHTHTAPRTRGSATCTPHTLLGFTTHTHTLHTTRLHTPHTCLHTHTHMHGLHAGHTHATPPHRTHSVHWFSHATLHAAAAVPYCTAIHTPSCLYGCAAPLLHYAHCLPGFGSLLVARLPRFTPCGFAWVHATQRLQFTVTRARAPHLRALQRPYAFAQLPCRRIRVPAARRSTVRRGHGLRCTILLPLRCRTPRVFAWQRLTAGLL